MTARAVHWHEGMFLRPHHFQAAQRFAAEQLHFSSAWDQHYNWGLREIDIDRDALGNHRLVIRSVKCRLRDGTTICVPEDGEIPALDLKPVLSGESTLTVYLGVPILHLGRANVAGVRPEEGGRFAVDTQDLEDENTGTHPQPVEVRRLNFRLLLSGQDHAGYETLPLVMFEKSAGVDATPRIQAVYIPPVVACDAWLPLQNDILQSIYNRIGRKIDILAEMVLSRGITLETQSQGDAVIVNQLRVLNEASALLNVLAFAQGIHPLTAYYELCRVVGQLAFFGDTRRPPELPRYDHDNLGYCFQQVRKHLEGLLYDVREPEYQQRPFEGAGKRMQVSMEPSWMEATWAMFIGVKCPLKPDEVIPLLTKGQLDMKIGSSEKVDRVFEMGALGLRFTHAPVPPRALPNIQNMNYFQVAREGEEWQNVVRSHTLAVRMNERLTGGNLTGQRQITIRKADGTMTTMEFTLFVVKAGA